MSRPPLDKTLHPRNRFRSGYDFDALIVASPALAGFVADNAYGNPSIDFSDPAAVKALNQALLSHAHGLTGWDLPPGALCPPVPGRSDHLHVLADLLASDGPSPGAIPRGRSVAVLDVGAGASCIYPLIGASEYGWRFVATDIDAESCAWATRLVAAHASVSDLIVYRHQSSPLRCFEGVVEAGETFDLSMSNPPFHASAEEAAEGNQRKRRHLARGESGGGGKDERAAGKRAAGKQGIGKRPAGEAAATDRNFGGRPGELWCPGGELGFVQRMITESARRPRLCRWFTSLVSQRAHLAQLARDLKAAGAVEVRTLDMAHGQKQSRILAWTFQSPEQRRPGRSGAPPRSPRAPRGPTNRR